MSLIEKMHEIEIWHAKRGTTLEAQGLPKEWKPGIVFWFLTLITWGVWYLFNRSWYDRENERRMAEWVEIQYLAIQQIKHEEKLDDIARIKAEAV